MDSIDTAKTVGGWNLDPTVRYIASVQRSDGLVPWYESGPADPWDHVESAMGLTIGGRYDAAEAAYAWLARNQLEDGSWWAMYEGSTPANEAQKETHRTAYVAVGAWHHYLATGDRAFLERLWPTVEQALEFALDLQSPAGEIYWATDGGGEPYRDALVSGCSSIYKSLECGAAIATTLGRPRPDWLDARARLGEAIRSRSDRFDRTWESKDGFSMDWFYPVLCGVVTGSAARDRLRMDADRFVEPGIGCRCVAEEPWVTVAESAELVLALTAVDRDDRGAELFRWLGRWLDDDGAFWTGYQFENDAVWPEEKPTWTAGAALLAADALTHRTPAADLFRRHDAHTDASS